MIRSLEQKVLVVTPPAAIVDNASPATTTVDRVQSGIAHDFVTFYVMVGATDIALTALKVQESDDSGMAGATDIAAFGAVGQPALPSATDDNKLYAIHVNCRGGRKRFLDLVVTVGDGAAGGYVVAWAVLSEGRESPASAADRGLAAEIFVN